MITDKQIEFAWNIALEKDGYDKDIWRLDPCGALIKKSDYGNRRSEFGWEIDHVVSWKSPVRVTPEAQCR